MWTVPHVPPVPAGRGYPKSQPLPGSGGWHDHVPRLEALALQDAAGLCRESVRGDAVAPGLDGDQGALQKSTTSSR
jgi:hypothetical protein